MTLDKKEQYKIAQKIVASKAKRRSIYLGNLNEELENISKKTGCSVDALKRFYEPRIRQMVENVFPKGETFTLPETEEDNEVALQLVILDIQRKEIKLHPADFARDIWNEADRIGIPPEKYKLFLAPIVKDAVGKRFFPASQKANQ